MMKLGNMSLLNKDTKLLLGLTGIGNLLMVMKGVFIPIYLLLLGFSTVQIGTYLMISTFASGITDSGLAILSTKFGKKKVLMINMFTSLFSFLIPLLTRNFSLVMLSAVFSYQGRTNSTADALLADNTTDDRRTNLFTLKLFLGSLFSVLGPIISGLPIIFQQYYNVSKLDSMMPLFLIGCIFTIASFILAFVLDESPVSKNVERVSIPKDQRQIIMKLATTHAIDTLAVGITLNIFSLWFTM